RARGILRWTGAGRFALWTRWSAGGGAIPRVGPLVGDGPDALGDRGGEGARRQPTAPPTSADARYGLPPGPPPGGCRHALCLGSRARGGGASDRGCVIEHHRPVSTRDRASLHGAGPAAVPRVDGGLSELVHPREVPR